MAYRPSRRRDHRRSHHRPGWSLSATASATLAGATLASGLLVAALTRRLGRFVVADRSMEPTLHSGQGLIGWRTNCVQVGELRCFEHPQQPGFWLVKRVAEVPAADTMTVCSDNRHAPTIDSRTFGPVRVAGSSRVIVRIPRRWM